MLNMLAIAIGAAIGANLRYAVSVWALHRFGSAFPYGTLIVNILGCIAIGSILGLAAERLPLSEPVRLLLVTGLLGGFTTFSSFGWEVYVLINLGNWLAVAAYIAASVIVGILGVFAGVALVRVVPV